MCNSVYLILWKLKLFLLMHMSETKLLPDNKAKEIYGIVHIHTTKKSIHDANLCQIMKSIKTKFR